MLPYQGQLPSAGITFQHDGLPTIQAVHNFADKGKSTNICSYGVQVIQARQPISPVYVQPGILRPSLQHGYTQNQLLHAQSQQWHPVFRHIYNKELLNRQSVETQNNQSTFGDFTLDRQTWLEKENNRQLKSNTIPQQPLLTSFNPNTQQSVETQNNQFTFGHFTLDRQSWLEKENNRQLQPNMITLNSNTQQSARPVINRVNQTNVVNNIPEVSNNLTRLSHASEVDVSAVENNSNSMSSVMIQVKQEPLDDPPHKRQKKEVVYLDLTQDSDDESESEIQTVLNKLPQMDTIQSLSNNNMPPSPALQPVPVVTDIASSINDTIHTVSCYDVTVNQPTVTQSTPRGEQLTRNTVSDEQENENILSVHQELDDKHLTKIKKERLGPRLKTTPLRSTPTYSKIRAFKDYASSGEVKPENKVFEDQPLFETGDTKKTDDTVDNTKIVEKATAAKEGSQKPGVCEMKSKSLTKALVIVKRLNVSTITGEDPSKHTDNSIPNATEVNSKPWDADIRVRLKKSIDPIKQFVEASKCVDKMKQKAKKRKQKVPKKLRSNFDPESSTLSKDVRTNSDTSPPLSTSPSVSTTKTTSNHKEKGNGFKDVTHKRRLSEEPQRSSSNCPKAKKHVYSPKEHAVLLKPCHSKKAIIKCKAENPVLQNSSHIFTKLNGKFEVRIRPGVPSTSIRKRTLSDSSCSSKQAKQTVSPEKVKRRDNNVSEISKCNEKNITASKPCLARRTGKPVKLLRQNSPSILPEHSVTRQDSYESIIPDESPVASPFTADCKSEKKDDFNANFFDIFNNFYEDGGSC